LSKSKLDSLQGFIARSWTRSRLSGALCAVLLLLASAAHAQTTSSISGTVRDAADSLVPGAKVTLINEASKGVRETKSNGEGFFSFAAVQSATYSIRVVHEGFETWTVTGIEVHPGDSLTVPKIKLVIGMIQQSVVVTAERAGVTLNSGEHSTLITSGDINRLSTTGRDATELVSMLPGFTISTGGDVGNQGPGGLYGNSLTTMAGAGGGSTSANMGSYGANGASPQQGLVNVTSDGANIIDPGDMSGTISTINMDQVQEVKVQTSNFGADEAKGPIVIDAVGKSGSDTYHGGLYTYFRNGALNSNDWIGKYLEQSRPANKYFYPGATIGGPVKIPGTHFNEKKRLVFWAGFEYYGQDQATNSPATAFVPTPAMLAGDLSPSTIASALGPGVTTAGLAANCAADYTVSSLYNAVAGICWSPTAVIDQNGNTVTGGNIGKTGSNSIDPAMAALTNLYPAINRIPQPQKDASGNDISASDGINYAHDVMQTHNGYQFHTREDENLSDTLKLYGTYNLESINDDNAMNNIFYNPNGTVPFSTPMMTHMKSQSLTLNLTKTIGTSITNELVGSGTLFNSPAQFADPSKAQVPSSSAWQSEGYTGGYFHSSQTQLPQIVQYETVGIPSLAMSYVPAGSQYLKKFSWNLADNLTKQYHTHNIKAGYYMEKTANNSMTLGSKVNGFASFMRWDACYQNQSMMAGTPPTLPTQPAQKTGMGNTVGNLLIGCPLGYQQDNIDPAINLRFMSFEGYLTDDWKVNSKLTITLGIRISHLQPWEDAHGIGMAVWDPSGMTQHTVYSNSADPTSWKGLDWHARDHSIPDAGVPTRAAFYSPRFGLAYDLRGNGKTVFRGGWGVYHSHDPILSYGGSAASTAAGLQTYTSPGTPACTFAQVSNFYGQTGQTSGSLTVGCGAYLGNAASLPAFNISALDPHDDRGPVTYSYNFTADQRGPWDSTFEVAYVGNQSSNISTLASNSVGSDLENQNVIPLNAYYGPDPVTGQTNPDSAIPNSADYRPYPNYQHVDVPSHSVWTNYNALQAGWNKQHGSLVYGVNYTWSKAMGVRGSYDTGYVSDPVNLHHDYGIVGIDRPQAINATYSYQEGNKFHGNRILGQVLNGWEISGITSFSSGIDLAISNGRANFGLSGGGGYSVGGASVQIPLTADVWLGSPDYAVQPTVTCDPRSGLKKEQYVNGACFGLPAQGSQGQWNLPDVHGPAYFKSDLSVYKDITLSARQNMQFRLSGFNFLNHPIPSFSDINLNNLYLAVGDPSGNNYTTPAQALAGLSITNTGSFGYTSYKSGLRIVELGFKYNF